MTERFGGKVALVTGATRGIGAATVRRLAREGGPRGLLWAHSGCRQRTGRRAWRAGTCAVCRRRSDASPTTARRLSMRRWRSSGGWTFW